MFKIKFSEGSQIKSYVIPNMVPEIEISMPLSTSIKAAWYDKVNKKENKTMDDLCHDVAQILKQDFNFKILREEQPRRDEHGDMVVTEGHPSPYKDSLSLYYYIRYNIADSDLLITDDGIFLTELGGAVIETDFIVRITDHPFTETGDKATREIDTENLNKLSDQEGGRPVYRSTGRQQAEISDKVRYDYAKGLAEIHPAMIKEIKVWRKDVKAFLMRARRGKQ